MTVSFPTISTAFGIFITKDDRNFPQVNLTVMLNSVGYFLTIDTKHAGRSIKKWVEKNQVSDEQRAKLRLLVSRLNMLCDYAQKKADVERKRETARAKERVKKNITK